MEWELRLRNEVSAAARQAGLDLREFSNAVRDAQLRLNELTGAEQRESAEAKNGKEAHESFFGDMFQADVLADKFNELTDRVAEMGVELLKSAAEATDFDYKATVALTHLTGSAEQAEDIIKHARAFANGVGEDVDKVVTSYQHLAAVGLRGDQLTAAAAGAKDLASVTGRSFEQTESLFELIGSDRGLGGRAVRQLAQFPPLLNELERHFGFVPGTAKSFEELTKRLTDAPIKGAAGLSTLEAMILKISHEKSLGQVGVEMGQTFEGAFTKIRNDWKESLGDMANDPAIVQLRTDFNEFADFFSPANAGGQMLHETLKALGAAADEAIREFKDNPDVIKGIFESAKAVAEGFVWTLEKIVALIKETQSAGAFWGTLAGGGSLEDAKLARAQAAHGDETPEERDLARQVDSAGFSGLPALAPLPSKADGGTVQSTGLVTVHKGEEIVPAGVTAGGGGSGGGHTFNFHISVDSGGHPVSEQAIAEKIQQLLPNELTNVFEQMAQQRGG